MAASLGARWTARQRNSANGRAARVRRQRVNETLHGHAPVLEPGAKWISFELPNFAYSSPMSSGVFVPSGAVSTPVNTYTPSGTSGRFGILSPPRSGSYSRANVSVSPSVPSTILPLGLSVKTHFAPAGGFAAGFFTSSRYPANTGATDTPCQRVKLLSSGSWPARRPFSFQT